MTDNQHFASRAARRAAEQGLDNTDSAAENLLGTKDGAKEILDSSDNALQENKGTNPSSNKREPQNAKVVNKNDLDNKNGSDNISASRATSHSLKQKKEFIIKEEKPSVIKADIAIPETLVIDESKGVSLNTGAIKLPDITTQTGAVPIVHSPETNEIQIQSNEQNIDTTFIKANVVGDDIKPSQMLPESKESRINANIISALFIVSIVLVLIAIGLIIYKILT